MFSAFFKWFTWHTCGCCNVVTVYMVNEIQNSTPGSVTFGCSYPGSDWIIVADTSGTSMGSTIVHEVGHLSDLWQHTSDPNNVMTNVGGGTEDQLTAGQCCLIRSSRFVTACKG